MGQLVQIAGALTILAAFALLQAGVLGARGRTYLLLNLGGALVLSVDAWLGRQWGFFLLEAVWAAIAAWGLVSAAARRG